jgi:hypothetical protein
MLFDDVVPRAVSEQDEGDSYRRTGGHTTNTVLHQHGLAVPANAHFYNHMVVEVNDKRTDRVFRALPDDLGEGADN